MSITLNDGATTLTLHPDLYWADELSWNPVEQNVERSLTGALIVQSTGIPNHAGRPITLVGVDENSAWLTRLEVQQLRNWTAVAGKQLTLTIYGSAYTVIFRHHEPPALEAQPVVYFNDKDDGDFFRVTIRLMCV